MKKFLKSKSNNQENTTRKIELNDTVDKKEKTHIIKNNSNKQRTRKRRRRRGRRNHRNNYSRTIELNVGLLFLKIIIIALLALLITTLTAKTVMTRIEGKVSDNLSGDTTEDVWQIISVSDEKETEDDGISTIDDSSDYTITVTEYTGDTLEAEYDYENGYVILYVVDGLTLEQQDVKLLTSTTYLSDYKIEKVRI